ncbi:uncharacterized protein V1516DRAFT_648218 [Lipomyces oligophaga]|uniref:uncharacterized protein n=1 Tax=Lipomyces oligophaga TaxID=45792 RepID=UPI0034CFF438
MATTSAPIEDAIPLDYVDPTTILLRRLDSWQHVADILEGYAEGHYSLYVNLVSGYEKIAKTVQEAPRFNSVELGSEMPLTPASSASPSSPEGATAISNGFSTLRTKQEGMVNAASEVVKSFKSTIIPNIERLQHDIKEHTKGLKTHGVKGAKEVEKARGLTQKSIEALGQNVASFGIFNGKAEPLKDPYVLYRHVLHDLDGQLVKENVQFDSLLSIQKDFSTFETHIVSSLRQTFEQIDQIQTKFWTFQTESYAAVTQSLTTIPDDFEWSSFVNANSHILAKDTTPKRTMDRVKFPNYEHESTKPIIEGIIQRKGTLTLSKNYNSSYYVVTPSKYLHQFASKDWVQHPEPEFSLYLPDCSLGAAYAQESGKNKFKLTGKDSSSTIARKHTFEFKTSTYEDLQKWWHVIHDVANSGNQPLSKSSTMSSATAAGASGALDTVEATPATPASPGSPSPSAMTAPEITTPIAEIPVAGSTVEAPDVEAATAAEPVVAETADVGIATETVVDSSANVGNEMPGQADVWK